MGVLNYYFSLFFQQPYAPPPHPMAPPSPSTNSCNQGVAEQLSKTNLYIRGLPPGTTDQDLIKLCQPWVLSLAVTSLSGVNGLDLFPVVVQGKQCNKLAFVKNKVNIHSDILLNKLHHLRVYHFDNVIFLFLGIDLDFFSNEETFVKNYAFIFITYDLHTGNGYPSPCSMPPCPEIFLDTSGWLWLSG